MAQTSKSHEVKLLQTAAECGDGAYCCLSAPFFLCFLWNQNYLRTWSKELNVPILSVDYSLSPEAPFPRALEECFYAYCWALRNSRLLGMGSGPAKVRIIPVSICRNWDCTLKITEIQDR